MKREKNIRIALSEEEYELLKGESDKKGIPMTSLIRLYIQGLKPEVENRSQRPQKEGGLPPEL
ncbi:MAG: hypothetical protein WBB29_17240 [Geitlerinemataceae cyanobacterium]